MLALIVACVAFSPFVVPLHDSKARWVLTWSDEFDGPAGNPPNPNKWKHDVGPKWYNNELEEYTAGAKNVTLDGHGHLVIEARNDGTMDRPHYTSARINTNGLFAQAYGRFEARIKLPGGKGIWPAFWMLGDDLGKAGWPGCGELDILEIRGSKPERVLGTAHGPGYSGADGKSKFTDNPGGSLTGDYHIYAVDWKPGEVKWYLDDTCYHTMTPADLGSSRWVFDHPFFVILNLAVGGDFDGNPDSTTTFPKRMYVDYVRVYKRAE